MTQESPEYDMIEQQGTAQQEQRSTDLLAALLCRVALELAQLATASLAYSTCLVPRLELHNTSSLTQPSHSPARHSLQQHLLTQCSTAHHRVCNARYLSITSTCLSWSNLHACMPAIPLQFTDTKVRHIG